MGNCQAAEAAAVVIQRPGGGGWTVEKVYWSVPAREVMAANPGHYVAAVTAVAAGPDGAPVRQLKLLRPDDTLTIGHVYRLICFQGWFFMLILSYTYGYVYFVFFFSFLYHMIHIKYKAPFFNVPICAEVLKELAGKKYAKLKQGRGGGEERRKDRKSEKMVIA